MRSAVTARLENERAAGARPAFPGRALWSRRRVLVLATVGLLAALALAAAARFAIGAIEIRVQPGVTPSASLPPVEPDALGDPVPAQEAVALAGFEPFLPSGPAPDEAYVVDSPFGDPGLVSRGGRARPIRPCRGRSGGSCCIAFQGDDETWSRACRRSRTCTLPRWAAPPRRGSPSATCSRSRPSAASQTFSVRGNVLIWEVDGMTYRLETSLDRASALEVAGSIA